MTDFDILEQMMKAAVTIPKELKGDKYTVTLDEPRTEGSRVVIHGMPEGSLVIKIDEFTSPDSVFNNYKGECKRADYAIIANTGKKNVIVFIEMKKTKDAPGEIIKQLHGARCFLSYCREIGKTFWNENAFLDRYRDRFVSIGHLSIAKRKTRFSRQSGVHDRPERMLKIDWPHHIVFNRLAGA